MSGTFLEQARLWHADVEAGYQNCVDDLMTPKKTHKDYVLMDHRLKIRLNGIQGSARKVIDYYSDNDSTRKNELSEISGENVFTNFYEQMKTLRNYHQQHNLENVGQSAEKKEDVKPTVKFTGAENFGKFVDMNELHSRFINLAHSFGDRCDYVSYLGRFYKFADIAKEKKLANKGKEYRKYLDELLGYLTGFFKRIHPLVDVAPMVKMIEADFQRRWEGKLVKGWFAKGAKKGEAAENGDVDMDEDTEQSQNPLFCQACQKMFAKETVYESHLNGRKHKKNSVLLQSQGTNSLKQKRKLLCKLLALKEEKIGRFAELLGEFIISTQQHVEKKQTRTFEESQADLEEESDVEEESESESDEEKPIYNPLNLPLGWDGKPIPYWLYKLHGLNIEYKCEICGGYSYWGPRAFERHFNDWRHAYGMRCLGIPNSEAFHNITKFADAIQLHQKLQKKKLEGVWQPHEQEEYEDDEGNVYQKKTYEDLKRQGVI